MERRIFWIVVAVLGLLAVILLPLWLAVAATIPIVLIAWWLGYQSPWLRRYIPVDKKASDSHRDITGKHAA
jgi:hypothetical protein